MSNINLTILTGNLTADSLLRRTKKGIDVLNFTIAVSYKKKNDDGFKEEKPDIFDIAYFGPSASYYETILKKGTGVVVKGKLRSDIRERDNFKYNKVDVLAEQIQITTPRKEILGDIKTDDMIFED